MNAADGVTGFVDDREVGIARKRGRGDQTATKQSRYQAQRFDVHISPLGWLIFSRSLSVPPLQCSSRQCGSLLKP
jgi:hypothetical protein